MSSLKQLKLAEKNAVQQREVVVELNALIADIERCERTITDLQRELAGINSKFTGPRTTREDIAYLTDLLKCAHKKLNWEKHIASLQKRMPVVLEKMSRLLNDPQAPPAAPVRAEMLEALRGVEAAMQRLQNVKTD
jgi:hypothetical protein